MSMRMLQREVTVASWNGHDVEELKQAT